MERVSSVESVTTVAGAKAPVTGGHDTTVAEAMQRSYDAVKQHTDGAFGTERPPLFSPAIAPQEASACKSGLHEWGPMFLPAEYSNWLDESRAHVETCYLGDWSALAKAVVQGPEALEFVSQLGMANLADFPLNRTKHHVQLDEYGRVASEGVICRVGEDAFLYTAGSSEWLAWQLSQGSWDAEASDITAKEFVFGVQGPTSIFSLEAATGESLRDIDFGASRMSRIGPHPVRILRVGISGELGYEIHGPAEHGAEIWIALRDAGKEFGLVQLGGAAQPVQHIEAGIATNGLDYMPSAAMTPGAPKLFRRRGMGGSFIPSGFEDYFRRPRELAWGPRDGSIPEHDFVGRRALLEDAHNPSRQLVGLIWNADDVIDIFAQTLRSDGELVDQMDLPRRRGPAFDQVLCGSDAVGVSTGRALSVNVRAMISLCVLDSALTAPGTDVTVVWGRPGTSQRHIRATVTELPFKPDRRRTDVANLRPPTMR